MSLVECTMPKAVKRLPPHAELDNLSPAKRTASQVLDLINSRPATPRLDEIAAIIEQSGGSTAELAPRHGGLDEWCGIINSYMEETSRPENEVDERADRLMNALCATTEAIWARPVRTWDDLVVRAAIAVHWNSSLLDTDPAYPGDILRVAIADSGPGYDEHALAHVVRGILDIAGLTFDPDGRLLSGPNVLGGRHHG